LYFTRFSRNVEWAMPTDHIRPKQKTLNCLIRSINLYTNRSILIILNLDFTESKMVCGQCPPWLEISRIPWGGEILDLDFEVKWCWRLKEFCPGGYCCVLEVGVMTAEELLERYSAGERDFSGVTIKSGNLINANLRDINLSDTDLSFTLLIATQLQGANLSEACLEGANLTCADLSCANLSRATLNGNLIGTSFYKAQMSGVVMYKANLTGANFQFANLQSSDLGATILIGTNFFGADLRDSNLEEASGIANFTEANLLNATTDGFEFSLGNSTFSKTIMQDGSTRSN
jgi:Pentapeptide repeats (8 copies)